MSPYPKQPPFAPGARGQLAAQAAFGPPVRLRRHAADRHEAMWVRLDVVAKQVAAQAGRRPGAVVPEPIRALAEAVLFESAGFAGRPRRNGLPMAATHYGPLAMQLGLALAAMSSFESRHTRWDSALKALVWQVDGPVLPVRRLRPRLVEAAPAASTRSQAEMADLRQKLVRRMEQFKQRDLPPTNPAASA